MIKGKYVCSFSVSFGSVTSDSSYSAQSYSYYPNVSGCDNMTTIKANIRAVASSNSFLKNSSNTPYYSTSYNSLYTFICDVNTDKTISLTHTTTANIYTANNAIINCIEIK